MIQNDRELQGALERIGWFQRQVNHLRQVEIDPATYRLSAGGFIAEIDSMNQEVRDYLMKHPSETDATP